jgi:drug/metabolite transporter (DMT)-like permease
MLGNSSDDGSAFDTPSNGAGHLLHPVAAPATNQQRVYGCWYTLMIPTVSLTVYLIFWVANAEMMQGVASGTFLVAEPYDHPAFLSWYAYNCLLLCWLPLLWYCQNTLKCTVYDYLQLSWAGNVTSFSYMVQCSCAMQFLLLLLNILWIIGLVHISVAMSNAIYQLQAAVTIGLSVCWLGNRFVVAEGIGMALSLLGVGLIVIPPLLDPSSEERNDDDSANSNETNPIVGITVTFLSAIVWAVYQIAWRVISKDKPEMDRLEGLMDTLATLGVMGVCNLFLCWPVLLMLHWTGMETFVMPSWQMVPALTVNGLVEFGFDLSCAIAIYLTSPVITEITAPLTIPISLIWDHFLHGSPLQVGHYDWFGSLLVLIGVVWIELKIPMPCFHKQTLHADSSEHPYTEMPRAFV